MRRRQTLLLATTALMPLSTFVASASPQGGQMVEGNATIVVGPGGSNVTVTQTSPNAIINWNTFNVGAGQTVQFSQPGSTSVVLDRVTGGGGPSQIFGEIGANGIVYLVNPNGILFGRGSSVNAAGFLATTHDIANGDFMAGRYHFNIAGNPSASIVNRGTITAASGGFAALVAPGVRNSGTITATLGTVGLASANGFTLDFYGDRLLTLAVNDVIAAKVMDVATGKPLSSLVSNTGKLSANGGKVVLTAAAARTVVDSVINTKGVIEANAIGSKGGTIVLAAATGKRKPAGAPTQTIKVAGTLSAAGKGAGQTGGNIKITGENIALAGATLDVSGTAGGGTVSIGGKGTLATATTVTADAATFINASATGSGDGGKVTIWSDQGTTVASLIDAMGGPKGGNGGTVETSGGTVDFAGIRLNTTASAGTTGSWLVDPTNLTVDATAAATIDSNLGSTNVTLQTNANGTTSGPGTTSSGPGDIIIAAPLIWGSRNTLTLDAYNAITVNAAITITGAGGLTLTAANNPLATAAPLISFGAGGSVQYTGTPNIGQRLTIDGQAYTLLYSMSDVQNINATSATLAGDYALAKPLDATGVTWTAIGTNGAGTVLNSGNGFTGAFQGLGNTISNLSVNLPSTNDIGLFGYVGSGLIQNFGLVGGSVSGSEHVGDLIGWNIGATVNNAYATGAVNGSEVVGGLIGASGGPLVNVNATGAVTGGSGSVAVGGLIGQNGGTGAVINAFATGPVTGGSNAFDLGGLIGLNDSTAAVTNAYATGAVTGGSGSSVIGGLIGQNVGNTNATVTNVYATGAVSGVGEVGGLVGLNTGSIAQAFASGAVSSGAGFAGGLVGLNSGGSITQSYATGAVSGGASGFAIGGLVGWNSSGTVTQSYATGTVSGLASSMTGGLIGTNGGTVTNSYWDVQTSGQTTSAGGTGLTTAQLQAALPAGFDPTVWGNIAGVSYPYLLWQFPGGTPQVVSGIAYNDRGTAPAGGGITVSGLVNGTSLTSVLTGGAVTTGANGYYYYLLAPGTISSSGAQALTYTAGANAGAAFQNNATASITGLDIYGGYLREISGAGTLSSVSAALSTAIGGNGTVQTLVNGLPNREIDATGTSFAVDQSVSTGTLVLSSTGAVTQSAPIAVTNLALLGIGGTYTLTNVGNSIGALAANTGTGTGSVSLTDSTNLAIGTVAGTSGVTANTLALTDTGTVTQSAPIAATNLALLGNGGTYTLNNISNQVGTLAANTGTVGLTDATNLAIGTVAGTAGITANTLALTDTGAVTQSAPINVTSLALLGGGTYTLNNTGNQVGTLAGNTGSVNLTDSTGLILGAVGGTSGVTASTLALTDTGTVTQTAPLNVTNLALFGNSGTYTLTNAGNQIGTLATNTGSGTGSISLTDSINLAIGSVGGTAGVTTGTLALNDTGAVTQSAPINVTNLALFGSGGSYTLTNSGNQVGTLAANTGAASLTDSINLAIGTVAGTTGVTASALTLTDSAAVTQSAPITVTNLALLGNGGSYTLTNAGNQIGILAANTGTGTIGLADSINLAIGSIGGTTGVTTGTLALNDTGLVTQSAPITAANLALLGNGGTYTLTNAGNQISTFAANTGTVSLNDQTNLAIGTAGVTAPGALTLGVNGTITAPGAVDVGTFTLAGGNWVQNNAVLPGFAATDFRIAGGSFLRATGGNGSAANPYQLADIYGLQGAVTPTGTGALLGKDYVLQSDVDTAVAAAWNAGAGFVTGATFAGIFNGQNHTIDNLVASSGLFGTIAAGATVENLNLANAAITGASNFTSIGALAGRNYGTISNVSASGIVSGGTNNGVVAGGLIGMNFGTITGSSASAAVSLSGGSASFGGEAGGLVGSSSGGAIVNSYATGNVTIAAINASLGVAAGGLVGAAVSTSVTGSSATGAVNVNITGANAASLVDAGGLIGTMSGGSITSSHAGGAVSVTVAGTSKNEGVAAGGLVAFNSGAAISNSYATGNVGSNAGNASLGGLVGYNVDAIIANAYATGNVGGSGVDVALGGLVGINAPGATILNSQAYGAVTAGANLSPNSTSCAANGNCQHVDAGGLVGANYGTIQSTTPWPTPPTGCTASYACASGNVTVGSLGTGGGLVGYNDGIIGYAFATGNVTGGAGVASTGGVFNNQTPIGGFVGLNSGQIANSFATGVVGTAGTAYLQAGGFAGGNSGTIANSFATGAVTAGDSSVIGGFVGTNSASTTFCNGCAGGDGDNNNASITNSQAYGNVTAGAAGVAGGFAGSGSGSFTNVTASGAVNASDNSILGGLVGALQVNGTITNSSAQNTLVASSGTNSVLGGIAGINGGTISGSTSSAPVSGQGNSFIGGLAGINDGVITNSFVDPAITGAGNNDVIGGIAGLNVGGIYGTTAQVALSGNSTSYVGGVAGINGTYSNLTVTIPNSSFPSGVITNSTANGTGFTSSVGTSTPSSTPNAPSWVASCSDTLCTILTEGTLQTGTSLPSTPGNPADNTNPNTSTTGNFGTQQTNQFTPYTQPASFNPSANTVPPPVVTPVAVGPTTGGTNGTNGGTGAGGNGGNGGNGPGGNVGGLANRLQGGNGAPLGTRLIDMPVMPLPPGSGLPPLGETRFVNNEVMLQFAANTTQQQIDDLVRRFGLTVTTTQSIGMLGRTVYGFRLPNGRSVSDMIRLIEAARVNVAVQPIYTYGLTQDQPGENPPAAGQNGPPTLQNAPPQLPADEILGDPAQYVIEKFQLGAAQRITKGDNVIIAVIDSEIDASHPDLAGVVTERYDAGCGAAGMPDPHGTGMTGAIASHQHLLGVAPNAKVIAICAFGGSAASGAESTSVKIINGIDYAIKQGARIINMSFAGPRDPALAQALQIAREKGILLVGAAGNAGPKSPPLYPGADPNVLAVTATDQADHLFRMANQGKYVAIAAPGVDILVPAPNAGAQLTTGTSVATAEVSGVAALLLAQKPSRTPVDIRNILMSTADHLGSKGVNPQFGAGLIDPLKALRLAPAQVSQR
jgi:filamentous hemagglutinin family protein